MKVQVTVDIPDGYELACEEMRAPKQGELFFYAGGVSVATFAFDESSTRIIVRPAWQWPVCLLCDWAGRDKYGTAMLGFGDPIPTESGWRSERYQRIHEPYFAINLPPCTDWRQSLRLNPNRKAKQ